ncbi:hypothetical protein AMK59_8752 [Oryctes borbonicus]|uniref:15-oxoprostaglandin 13-reductase n=1 Tax=Oryctes borbonicus TaxID=1629725 RepID=A0A0T6AU66_9SCAR|nr:hypothetical protein AMK59_8752 [Oryctes borbonicus]
MIHSSHFVGSFLRVNDLPRNSAYFGFLEICRPQHGNTVVISGAGGAVGSHVGQIAKIRSCNVIGISGSDEKNTWLRSIGFDHVINYKTEDIPGALKRCAPNGVDCYFDNVGGELSSQVIQKMNRYGRISVCGSISSYNVKPWQLPKATIMQPSVVMNELEMKGFLVSTWKNRWMEGINQNLKWLVDGKLLYRETITNDFENMPKAFIGVLNGENIGKAIVKV